VNLEIYDIIPNSNRLTDPSYKAPGASTGKALNLSKGLLFYLIENSINGYWSYLMLYYNLIIFIL